MGSRDTHVDCKEEETRKEQSWKQLQRNIIRLKKRTGATRREQTKERQTMKGTENKHEV